MIRSVIALFAFSVAICALIIYGADNSPARPMASDRLGTPVAPDVDVTRAINTPDANLLVPQQAAAPAPQPAVATVQEPIRTPVQAPQRIDVPRPQTDDTSLDATTQNVLAELGFSGVEPVATPSRQQAQSTANILAGIEAATGQNNQFQERSTLETLVVSALRAGESDENIDVLVNTAAAAGDVVVPKILVTSDGRVDTHILLANIVSQAQVAAGVPQQILQNPTPENTRGMEVRVTQRATDEIESRFYTVQPGDSLGAISRKFYGTIYRYPIIFEANKHLLSSPDRIRIGQRLVIPQLGD